MQLSLSSCSRCSGGGQEEPEQAASEEKEEQAEEKPVKPVKEDESIYRPGSQTLSKGLVTYLTGEVYTELNGEETRTLIG